MFVTDKKTRKKKNQSRFFLIFHYLAHFQCNIYPSLGAMFKLFESSDAIQKKTIPDEMKQKKRGG